MNQLFGLQHRRAKAFIFSAFALSGRWLFRISTQGVALGYVLVGLSGRFPRIPIVKNIYILNVVHQEVPLFSSKSGTFLSVKRYFSPRKAVLFFL